MRFGAGVLARRAAAVAVAVLLSASLWTPSGGAAVPFAVRVSSPDLVAPGRVSFDVLTRGLDTSRAETIEGHAVVGGTTIELPATNLASPVDRLAVVLDLGAGQVWIGGAAAASFTPIPPIGRNTPVNLEILVRQDGETAIGRQTGLLMLPVVLVPGYLNEMLGKRQDLLAVFRRRGYRDGGPSPNLFWFKYRSKSLGVEETARLLAAYVRDVVLPGAYASRVNVVGYSAGGLSARWDAAFDPSWARLLNALFLVAVPNEGSVMAYLYAWYPAAKLARTRTARCFLPTYPYWRPTPGAPWQIPRGAENVELERLNAQPLPDGTRVYVFYGSRPPAAGNSPGTLAAVTGSLPEAAFLYGAGDGILLSGSVLGQPINGGAEVAGLSSRFTTPVNLGPLDHFAVLRAAVPRIAEITAATPRTADWGISAALDPARHVWEPLGAAAVWVPGPPVGYARHARSGRAGSAR